LADEPGLGKTVTVLALISTTAGRYPQTHSELWDNELLQQRWALLQSEQSALLLPLLNRLVRSCLLFQADPAPLENVKRELTSSNRITSYSLSQVEQKGIIFIFHLIYI
jgi:hypothetical protein